MRTTTLIAIASILVAACASLVSAQTPTTTKVMVDTKDPKKPLIWIDQEPIIVRGTNEVTITWEIATTGYEFPDNGVAFEGEGTKQFIKCVPTKGRQRFECVDRNTQTGQFKYTITVVRTGTKEGPPPLDPTVMND